MATVWDPLRKRHVSLTPEEGVRQWFIAQLNTVMKVPLHMMMSEVGFRLGNKKFRADILIYGRDTMPLAVVECKNPGVRIDNSVLDQALRYNMVLNVKYIIITNGCNTFIAKKKNKATEYVFISDVPLYDEMTGDEVSSSEP